MHTRSRSNPVIMPPTPYNSYIIESVMPSEEIHLLGGPPGVSKTSLGMQLLCDIEEGRDIFGYHTHPTKSVFVSCDRSERAHLRRLDGFGLPPDRFPFFSGRDQDLTLSAIIQGCYSHYPDRPLLFIDGIASLLDGNLSDYTDVQQFLRSGGQLCEKYHRTLLGTVHASKAREGASYPNPRDQLVGSTAWGGFSDLTLVLQFADSKDISNPDRLLHVCTRGPATEFTVRMRKDRLTGRLVELDPDLDLLSLLDSWILKQDFTRIIPTGEISEIGTKEFQLSPRSIERWLNRQVESGLLERMERGKYQRRMVI
jgi:AAA domain